MTRALHGPISPTVSEAEKWHWTEGNRYAHEGMKSLLILNGGAAVAILALIGSVGVRAVAEVSLAVGIALVSFGNGAMSSAFAFMFAYLTQLEYGNGSTPEARKWHRATYLSTALAALWFLFGVGMAAYAITGMGTE